MWSIENCMFFPGFVLASQSPRRKELLESAGFRFTVDPVKVSEIIDENLSFQDAIKALAWKKARATAALPKYSNKKGFLILAADTLVRIETPTLVKTLGKPENASEAEEILALLSGKTHSVISAICLYDSENRISREAVCETKVEFLPLTREAIKSYVKSGEPMDKAGAYAIQGEGRKFVKRFEGSYSNVVGLPLETLERVLRENDWQVDRRKP